MLRFRGPKITDFEDLWFRGPENQRFSRAPNPKGLRDFVNM
ncbi:hypothetical protein [Methanobacterium sp.]